MLRATCLLDSIVPSALSPREERSDHSPIELDEASTREHASQGQGMTVTATPKMISGAFTIATDATPAVLNLDDGTYLLEPFGPDQGGIRYDEEQLALLIAQALKARDFDAETA